MAEEKDCGLLKEEEVLATELEKVKLEEEKEEHQGVLEKLHRADSTSSSSSSSSSSEEEGEETCENTEEKEKKKKKKSIKEKIKEKMECTTTTEAEAVQVADVAAATTTTTTLDEKKGLLDKIKDKIQGHSPKKPSEEVEVVSSPVTPTEVPQAEHEGEGAKDKKGFLGKIMDKIPGYHKNTPDGGEEKQGGATH